MDQQVERDRREELEWTLKMNQMLADIELKSTQSAAEWPKVWTAMLVAFGAVCGGIGAGVGALITAHVLSR
jgi:hypothetical protein